MQVLVHRLVEPSKAEEIFPRGELKISRRVKPKELLKARIRNGLYYGSSVFQHPVLKHLHGSFGIASIRLCPDAFRHIKPWHFVKTCRPALQQLVEIAPARRENQDHVRIGGKHPRV